ncbi:MAG: FHA domain-containing protein [Coriobacteriia bacterium]|nr:FHA domain-containing protein [Coriobacteriia bacterium]
MIDICPVCGTQVSEEDSVCSACGFKLSGTTQSFAPISVTEFDLDTTPKNKKSTLRIIRGPQIGTIFMLGVEEMTIGRNPRCNIFLNDMTVSRGHAKVVPMDKGYCIVDDSSYNGVWVNDKAVGRAFLNQGDIVQIGVFCLVYEQE